VAIGGDPNLGSFVPTVLELVRCVRPGGTLMLNLLPGSAPNTEDLRWSFDLAQSRQVGSKCRVIWPAELGGFGDDAVVAAGAGLFVELTDATPAVTDAAPAPDATAAARAVVLAAEAEALALAEGAELLAAPAAAEPIAAPVPARPAAAALGAKPARKPKTGAA